MRKNILYAPRLRGDLGLGLEPSRIVGGVKDWARMAFPGGRIDGMPEQEVGDQSLLANYHIGTRRVQDERVFRYCHADLTDGIELAYYGAQNNHDFNSDNSLDCISGVTIGAKVRGNTTLEVLDNNPDHTADFFAGGWAAVTVLPPADVIIQMHRIRSSTPQAVADGGNGTSVTVTLWDPLVVAEPEASMITVYPSIYGKVQRQSAGGDSRRATVCVPLNFVDPGYYFWGQVAGPCYGALSEAFPKGTYEQRLVFSHDGSIMLEHDWAANEIHQYAGYRLTNYIDDEAGALLLYMLQIGC